MRIKIRLISALVFLTTCGHLLFLTACGNPGSSTPVSPVQTQKIPLTCSASTTASVVPYSLSNNNNTLLFGTSSMTRISSGAAGLPVYGTWLAVDQSSGGFHIKGILEITASAVTISADCDYSDGRKTTAIATSAATISSTDIMILETKKVAIPFLHEDTTEVEEAKQLPRI